MSNQLNKPQDISPSTVIDPATGNALTNALTAAFGTRDPRSPTGSGDWVSEPFHCPGTPGDRQGAGSLTFLLDMDFGGGVITILPEHAPPSADGVTPPADASFYPMGRLNSSNEAENDTVVIDSANLLGGQLKIDLPLSVPSSHWVRLRAISAGGGGSLQARVTAGRS